MFFHIVCGIEEMSLLLNLSQTKFEGELCNLILLLKAPSIASNDPVLNTVEARFP